MLCGLAPDCTFITAPPAEVPVRVWTSFALPTRSYLLVGDQRRSVLALTSALWLIALPCRSYEITMGDSSAGMCMAT